MMNGIKDTSVDEESETGSDTFDDSRKGVLVVLPFNKFSSPILVNERTAHLYHMQLQTKKSHCAISASQFPKLVRIL